MIQLSHDEVVDRAIVAAAALTPKQAASAFAASLSTRRLDWRSTLGSLAAVQHLSRHAFVPRSVKDPGHCAVCGLQQQVALDLDGLAELRAEQRYLVRFYDVAYAVADLEAFPGVQVPEPTPADLDLLQALLEGLRSPGMKLGQLNAAIRVGFKSNKNQRAYILEALGVAGILCPTEVPSFETRWVSYQEREFGLSVHHFYSKDAAYPLRHWSSESRLNEQAVQRWFGELI